MPIKIFGQVEEQIRALVAEGYNAAYIEKQTNLSWGTINSWCKKNGIVLGNYRNPELRAKEIRLVELIKLGTIMKHACKEVNIDDGVGVKWAIRNGLAHTLRNRTEAAKDRKTTLEEAKARLPEGHGELVHYDPEKNVYVIKREDGTTYDRILSQIFRGDPKKGEKARIEEKDAAEILLKMGYRLIPGTFTIKRKSIKAEHIVCGYIRETKLAMFPKQSCPRCTNRGTSVEEVGLDDWIRSLGIETCKFRFKKDCLGKGKGKEIDIYIPELKLGIEYCGLRFHGEMNKKRQTENKIKEYAKRGKTYKEIPYDSPRLCHKIKLDKATELGISLITVFSNEWKDSPDKVKAILKAKLGKNEIKIGARETELKEIDRTTAKQFLDSYHLQGSAAMLVAFGLFFEGELVAVITGNNHHRMEGKFVLNRLCFKANTTVSGGSSKLNKALEEWAKGAGINEIMSWSDNRWSNGGVYKALGYTLSGELASDYFYFGNNGKTFSKQSCQKKMLLAKGAVGETEWEMAQSLKLDRIFDCGKKTWVKKLI